MRKIVVLAALGVGLGLAAGTVQAAEGPTGTWRMSNGKVTVRVAHCGGALCGTVVALKRARDDKGRPRLDKENPNPALRSRPVIGLTILSNMRADGQSSWSGTIYNPDDGNTYASEMQLLDSATMKVNGCVAGMFCRSMKFIRVQ